MAGSVQLLCAGVDSELPVHKANFHAGDGPVEGGVGDAEGNRGAVHREYRRLHSGFHRHDCGYHLNVVSEALGKQRAYGPVDLPPRQDSSLARAALALNEPSGDLAYCI